MHSIGPQTTFFVYQSISTQPASRLISPANYFFLYRCSSLRGEPSCDCSEWGPSAGIPPSQLVACPGFFFFFFFSLLSRLFFSLSMRPRPHPGTVTRQSLSHWRTPSSEGGGQCVFLFQSDRMFLARTPSLRGLTRATKVINEGAGCFFCHLWSRGSN